MPSMPYRYLRYLAAVSPARRFRLMRCNIQPVFSPGLTFFSRKEKKKNVPEVPWALATLSLALPLSFYVIVPFFLSTCVRSTVVPYNVRRHSVPYEYELQLPSTCKVQTNLHQHQPLPNLAISLMLLFSLPFDRLKTITSVNVPTQVHNTYPRALSNVQIPFLLQHSPHHFPEQALDWPPCTCSVGTFGDPPGILPQIKRRNGKLEGQRRSNLAQRRLLM